MNVLEKLSVAVALVGGLVAGTAIYDRFETERLKGPKSEAPTLIKAAELAVYARSLYPCPGYPHATFAVVGYKVLGDCDGDGFVDEVTSPPPTGNGEQIYLRNWALVLRPGVKSVHFANGEAVFGMTEYRSDSPSNGEMQRLFERTIKYIGPPK